MDKCPSKLCPSSYKMHTKFSQIQKTNSQKERTETMDRNVSIIKRKEGGAFTALILSFVHPPFKLVTFNRKFYFKEEKNTRMVRSKMQLISQ